MEILLEEYYKSDFSHEKFVPRKLFLEQKSYQICGITQSGKTKLVKSYLSTLKKKSYLYIDCNDIRINIEALNATLSGFCLANKIQTLVLDNYKEEISFVNVAQLIIITQTPLQTPLELIWVNPLDYEEFLAYEFKYDSSTLNHYLQQGSLPVMHTLELQERTIYLQQKLQMALDPVEFTLLTFIAQQNTTQLSPFSIYQRLKQKQRISKDKTYQAYKQLLQKRYIYEVEKFLHKKATKNLYLGDIYFKTALSMEKHFGRLFENMIFLELIKQGRIPTYSDGIEFYLEEEDEIIFCKPFADERRLFQKLESIEAFIFSYAVKKITVVTMNKEASISHPLSKVEMVPFDIWALGD